MRSIFPALHDRRLGAILCGAVALLAVTIFAISVIDRDEEPEPSEKNRAMIIFSGASPAN